jgi:hypothetical protein
LSFDRVREWNRLGSGVNQQAWRRCELSAQTQPIPCCWQSVVLAQNPPMTDAQSSRPAPLQQIVSFGSQQSPLPDNPSQSEIGSGRRTDDPAKPRQAASAS